MILLRTNGSSDIDNDSDKQSHYHVSSGFKTRSCSICIINSTVGLKGIVQQEIVEFVTRKASTSFGLPLHRPEGPSAHEIHQVPP